MTYRIKLDNIQKSVDEEMRHINDDEGEFTFRFDGGPTDSRSEFNLFNYHPLEKIYDFVTQVKPSCFQIVIMSMINSLIPGFSAKTANEL